MTLITLVMTVCLISSPEACREESLQLQESGSLTQCLFRSMTYIAQWSAEHPALRVKRWRCQPAEVGRMI
ncbi:hypothetical protein C7U60_09480 [Mesorhizobium plurifarium]|uniref:hypothetical protein n=1 Tax=Sinorhizobium arboris TaxID=76745 RepID=UPI000407A291|nr:hypothetical protein [Sinorhizobium arboris]PST24142.1 hypothetical protein C7U60_09480 [Mesorhizobium plurifarium]